jgi:transposase
MFLVMSNAAELSKEELIKRLEQQAATIDTRDQELASRDQELASRDQELASRDQELAQSKDIIRQNEEKIRQLEKDYLQLIRERFGRKSERYIASPDQLRIDFGDTDDAANAAEGLADAVEEAELVPAHLRRKPRKKTDRSFPAHFPRREEIVDVAEPDKSCEAHGEKQLLPESMWDVVEKLIHIPAQFEVLVRKYKKYACLNHKECGIASPERPTGIVEGDRYDASVAASIITQKYGYHLPLYRQQNMFASSGWTPSRSLMLNILQNCDFIIAPLLEHFRRTLKTDSIVACDDTGVTLLYPKVLPEFDDDDPKQKRAAEVFEKALTENKSSINAKMWAYRGVNVPLNVFDFTVSRHRDGPDLFYRDFQGTILGDCWHGFGGIAMDSNGNIVRGACNAHARRKFENASDYPADRDVWMKFFHELYDAEHLADEQAIELQAADPLSDEAHRERELLLRRSLRQVRAKPVWDRMKAELESIEDRTENVVLPKSDFRKALNYLRNHWTELMRYLDDPLLPIDNNECEQLMREVAVGRKNWLFCGSISGGERTAGLLTLVSSAHRANVDVWSYVDDVLRQLLAGQTDYDPLLPWNWAAAHPESIRQFRDKERRAVKARKQAVRSHRRKQ